MKTKTMTAISLLLVLSLAWTTKADSGAKHEDKENDGGDKPRFGVGVSFSPLNTIVPEIEIPPLQLADFRVVPLSPVAAADQQKDEFLALAFDDEARRSATSDRSRRSGNDRQTRGRASVWLAVALARPCR